MSQEKTPETLGDRLNDEPVVILGVSQSEFTILIVSGVLVCLPSSIALSSIIGYIQAGFGIGFFLLIGYIYAGSHIFRHIKRGRPDFYYNRLVKLTLHKYGLKPCQYITHTGKWGVRGGPLNKITKHSR